MKLPDLNNISSTGLFDRGSVRAYGLACALAALEEAAKACEYRGNSFYPESPFHAECHVFAATIRALRTELENTK